MISQRGKIVQQGYKHVIEPFAAIQPSTIEEPTSRQEEPGFSLRERKSGGFSRYLVAFPHIYYVVSYELGS